MGLFNKLLFVGMSDKNLFRLSDLLPRVAGWNFKMGHQPWGRLRHFFPQYFYNSYLYLILQLSVFLWRRNRISHIEKLNRKYYINIKLWGFYVLRVNRKLILESTSQGLGQPWVIHSNFKENVIKYNHSDIWLLGDWNKYHLLLEMLLSESKIYCVCFGLSCLSRFCWKQFLEIIKIHQAMRSLTIKE